MKIQELIALQREHAPTQAKTTLKYRLSKLDEFAKALKGRWKEPLEQALAKDFGKSTAETSLTELFPTLDNIKLIRKNLKNWTKPKRVPTPLPLLGSTSYVIPEPKGNTLVIAPWNYPIFLSLHPMITSFAAGNTVIVKPSELTPNTSEVLAALIADVFEPQEVSVVLGGVAESTELLSNKFNHIFFTGSTAVGKIVMEAASKHLGSVTLELGGKSPTIVDHSANAVEAGKRIAWAKFTNAGQICIAPDHIYVHSSKVEDFKKGITTAIKSYYGPNPEQHKDYVQIVNDRHFMRLSGLLSEAQNQEGSWWTSPSIDFNKRTIAPSVVLNPPKDGALMREELFGPLLPVFSYSSIDEVLDEINSREHPLVVYIYSKSQKSINHIQQNTRAGATAVNMSLLQIANNNLPFGGVGHSGMGKTNGYAGFKEFTNERSTFYQWGPPINNFLSAPFTKGKKKLIDALLKWLY